MKNFRFWLWSASVLQLLTALIHAMSFLRDQQPANESEKTLLDLMRNYQFTLAGMQVTMESLFTALSACFSLTYLLGALVNIFLLRRPEAGPLLGGILWINLLVFGMGFALMAAFTFPPPIVLTGLVFLCLLLALVTKSMAARA